MIQRAPGSYVNTMYSTDKAS